MSIFTASAGNKNLNIAFIKRFNKPQKNDFPTLTIKNSLIPTSLKAQGKFILLLCYLIVHQSAPTHLSFIVLILQVHVGSGLENHGVVDVNLFTLGRTSLGDINRWISVHFR
jgi:hypothetical protein